MKGLASTAAPRRMILGLVALCLGMAIPVQGEPPRERIEPSHDRPPEWVRVVPPSDSRYLYFVGRAGGAHRLEDAESDAAMDAVRQAVLLSGVSARIDYDRLRRESDLLLTDRLEVEGAALVVGLKRLESYYAKRTLARGDSLLVRYEAHLLVRYPHAELSAEKRRLELESASRVTTAESLLAEGLALERQGQPARAFPLADRALELVSGQFIHAGLATRERQLRLEDPLSEALHRLGLALGRVSVPAVRLVRSAGTDSLAVADTLLAAKLAAALLKAGLTPERDRQSARALLLPRITVTAREEAARTLGEGFALSRWSVLLELSDPREGTVLLSESFPVKGFGPDGPRARLEALRQLEREVFPRFARSARARLMPVP